ncbi:MAG TPA: hypothetical protein VMU68_03835 [Acidimicrobiales bacterium]|nr:hypothetical protein [Acidimicrobiales bacterium]
MSQYSRERIRAIVIFGFLLSAAAGVIAYANEVTSLGYRYGSFGEVVDPLLSPLTTISALCAWVWLTCVVPRDDAQRRILRSVYLFFAIQYLLSAVGFNFIFTPIRSFGGLWITLSLWLEFIGAVVVTFGLFLTFRSLDSPGEVEHPLVDVDESG